MPLATVVAHGESVIITFYEDGDDGRDPADKGNEREDKDADGVDALPEGVAEGEAYSATEIGPELTAYLELEFFAIYQRFCLLAEIGEEGRSVDKKEVLEQREKEEEEHDVHHASAHDEQKA